MNHQVINALDGMKKRVQGMERKQLVRRDGKLKSDAVAKMMRYDRFKRELISRGLDDSGYPGFVDLIKKE